MTCLREWAQSRKLCSSLSPEMRFKGGWQGYYGNLPRSSFVCPPIPSFQSRPFLKKALEFPQQKEGSYVCPASTRFSFSVAAGG